MKKKVLALLACTLLTLSACGEEEAAVTSEKTEETGEESDTTADLSLGVSNSLFSITLPKECEGLFEAETSDDQITIYDKEAKEAGFGGMAFTIAARKLPSEYAGGPYTKVGELTDADGNKYDVVLGYATEVQWNYEESEDPTESFNTLYNSAEIVAANMTGVNGATYEFGAGTKGEDLYGEVLEKYITAVDEGWDASKFEENGMSPEFYSLGQESLDNIGFAYYDENKDGIDELFVGTIKDDELKGAAYDIYTMVDGAPELVVSGSARDRYYMYDNYFLVNEYSGGAMENGKSVYDISPNTTELVLQWATKYDAYENEEQPWFISYDGEEWENVTEEEFNDREASSDDYTALDYKPLSEAK